MKQKTNNIQVLKDNQTEFSAYEKVQIARKTDRPHAQDFIRNLFNDFIELKGDRLYRNDPSVIGGIASFHGRPVTVIGQQKGNSTEDNVRRNFGMTSPEGYRKALRLMKQAEKFCRPVITFIDTPGAYPGVEAEQNGQFNAIAENLAAMSSLEVPIIAIITGEGSSGGALALAVSDCVLMLEHAVFAILSPEGFASILWKDASRAQEASELMHLTAVDLLHAGQIDHIVPETRKMYRELDQILQEELEKLCRLSPRKLISGRYRKYREIDGDYRPEREES